MNHRSQWRRVSRSSPCPICGKPNWCLVSTDEAVAICPRISEAAVKDLGEAGWLHRLKDLPWQPDRPRRSVIRITPPYSSKRDLTRLVNNFRDAVDPDSLKCLADELSLSVTSLFRLAVGWSHEVGAWIFPVSDEGGRIVGCNRRYRDGSKRMLHGHHVGLYLPTDLPEDLDGQTLLICEGATDTAAALDLGYQAVGRFSCKHGASSLTELVRSRRPGLVVICADAKPQEREGAETLASVLLPYVLGLKVIVPPPPHQDLRAWKKDGAVYQTVRQIISVAPIRRFQILVRLDGAAGGNR